MHEHFLIPLGAKLWWIGFGIFLIYTVIIFILGRNYVQKNNELKFRHFWLSLLILREIAFHSFIVYNNHFTFQESLPLHLCGISYILSMILLWTESAFIFEFILLLGIGGAVQSIITPELTHGFSIYLYLDYYLSHGTIIIVPLYMFFILKKRLRPKSYLNIWIFAHVLLISVGLINYFLSSNYIYLCIPPKVDNVLVTGKYPQHLIGFEIFGTLHILLFYYLFTKVFGQKKDEEKIMPT